MAPSYSSVGRNEEGVAQVSAKIYDRVQQYHAQIGVRCLAQCCAARMKSVCACSGDHGTI